MTTGWITVNRHNLKVQRILSKKTPTNQPTKKQPQNNNPKQIVFLLFLSDKLIAGPKCKFKYSEELPDYAFSFQSFYSSLFPKFFHSCYSLLHSSFSDKMHNLFIRRLIFHALPQSELIYKLKVCSWEHSFVGFKLEISSQSYKWQFGLVNYKYSHHFSTCLERGNGTSCSKLAWPGEVLPPKGV